MLFLPECNIKRCFCLQPGVYPAPQQQGYVQPQQGFVQPQQGFVQPQHGYVQPQQGYAQPQQGYPQPQLGYAQPQPGHFQQSQTVYPPQDPGMVKQDLHQQGYTPQPADAPQAEPRAPPAYSAVDPSSTQEQYMVRALFSNFCILALNRNLP